MNTEPCYFYVDYSDDPEGRIWPLCAECGKKWPNAMYWDKGYGPWEIRCHNPICKTAGGKVIWEGKTDSNLP